MKRFGLAAALLALAAALFLLFSYYGGRENPIRIGAIFSLTGTMALSEKPLVDAVTLAVEEINAAGGLIGRPVELLVADGRSDPAIAAAEAERLITKEKVSMLAACWTSACRKAVKPVVERHDHLMLYAVQYEGMENSPNIIYTGALPNQQLIPGAQWVLEHVGKRFYLIGSDYIFPRTANVILKEVIRSGGGIVAGERYLPLGSRNLTAAVDEIRELKPDAVLNTINGDTNLYFFRAMRKAGLKDMPVMSFSIAEGEMKAMEGNTITSHYAVWSYFQGMKRDENTLFVNAYKARFGQDKATSDPVEAAYVGVRLWAQAVRDVGSDSPALVNRSILRQSFNAPSGITSVDRATRHLWKIARIEKVRADGLMDEVWTTSHPLRPSPFPGFKEKSEWLDILHPERHGKRP